jgi:biotin carboxylase
MKKRILMLGAGFMQGVAIRCAKSRGWDVVVVDGNPAAPCASLADRFEPIDLKDRESLAAFAKSLMASGGLDGVFTAATDFSASVSYVAEACGLPGHSFEAALNASDKVRMRARFDRAGVPSPAFIGIGESDRADAASLVASRGIAFPLVVKPADNMGARGCRKVDGSESLDVAIADAIRYSRTRTAIVEEYMDGPEFSLEALVYDGVIRMAGFADRHIFFPPYFIEMGHTIPSDLSEENKRALVDAFSKGIRALGLSHGVAKGDVKLTPKGPMIGEIAGRLSGGYMSGWTFPYSSGIDLTGAALDLAVGSRPSSVEPTLGFVAAERAWISVPGVAESVSGLDEARSIPFVRDVFPRSVAGAAVKFPVNNVEKCGNCIAVAPSRAEAISAAERACRAVFIRLKPSNPDTDAFLASAFTADSFPASASRADAFPPDAFPLGADRPSILASIRAASVPADYSAFDSVPVPVPAPLVPFLGSATDWQGRTLAEAVREACRLEPALMAELSEDALARYDRSGSELTRVSAYWLALVRGGIQGMIYAYDSR